MSELIVIELNGHPVEVEAGCSVASAIMNQGSHCRRSVSGEARAALCGMGICYECRATINGHKHSRSCMLSCQPGMKVETQ
jgi:D-hydroxyproline dehydrogenase subunit gamma